MFTVDKLVSMYLNKMGRVNAQFTIHFKQASKDIQNAVLTKIEKLGMRPYQIVYQSDKTKIESIEQVLQEIEKDKENATEWLDVVIAAENYYRRMLENLRSGSAGATLQQKADSIGQTVSATVFCGTCPGVALGTLGIPEQ